MLYDYLKVSRGIQGVDNRQRGGMALPWQSPSSSYISFLCHWNVNHRARRHTELTYHLKSPHCIADSNDVALMLEVRSAPHGDKPPNAVSRSSRQTRFYCQSGLVTISFQKQRSLEKGTGLKMDCYVNEALY